MGSGPQLFGELRQNRQHGGDRRDGQVGDGQRDEPQSGCPGEAGLVGETECGALGVRKGAHEDVGAHSAEGRHIGCQVPVAAGAGHGAQASWLLRTGDGEEGGGGGRLRHRAVAPGRSRR